MRSFRLDRRGFQTPVAFGARGGVFARARARRGGGGGAPGGRRSRPSDPHSVSQPRVPPRPGMASVLPPSGRACPPGPRRSRGRVPRFPVARVPAAGPAHPGGGHTQPEGRGHVHTRHRRPRPRRIPKGDPGSRGKGPAEAKLELTGRQAVRHHPPPHHPASELSMTSEPRTPQNHPRPAPHGPRVAGAPSPPIHSGPGGRLRPGPRSARGGGGGGGTLARCRGPAAPRPGIKGRMGPGWPQRL